MPDDNGDEDEDPNLPPLISYCAYLRYGFAIAKWPLLFAIFNLVVYGMCRKNGYFGYDNILPFDSIVLGGLLVGGWFSTAVWAFFFARMVEVDVQNYDNMAHYELGRQEEGADQQDVETNHAPPTVWIPDYQHVYGRISRNLDASFSRKQHGPTTHPRASNDNSTDEGTTSSLVNLGYCLWSLMLALAVFLMTGMLLGKANLQDCQKKQDASGSSSPHKADYSNLTTYPKSTQEWIVAQNDLYGDLMFQDDYHFQGDAYSFPTAYTSEVGNFAELPDGTIFFAGLPPPALQNFVDDGNVYVRSKHTILVESPGGGGPAIYHEDIWNPSMFIPVQSRISKNAEGRTITSQFCLETTKVEGSSHGNDGLRVHRSHIFYCVSSNSKGRFDDELDVDGVDRPYIMQDVKIEWLDEMYGNPSFLTAASTGSEVLIAHVGQDNENRYQEVVTITPSSANGNRLVATGVYHLTTASDYDPYDYYYYRSERTVSKCVQEHVLALSCLTGIVVLLLSGSWLIFREGVPAGITPLALLIVVIIRYAEGERYDMYHASAVRGAAVALVVGTLCFHCILCCGNVCQLPACITRHMYVWCLYSWMAAFFIVYFLSKEFFLADATSTIALVLLGLSGLILNNPVLQYIGYSMVSIGILAAIQEPFFRMMYGSGIGFGFFLVLLGLGVIGLDNRLSANRHYCRALCRPFSNTAKAIFYGSRRNVSTSTQ